MEIPNWSKSYLKQERVQLVLNAIKEAEKKTAGEIVPMIVRRSSTIGHVPVILLGIFVILFLALDVSSIQTEFLGGSWLWYALDFIVIASLAVLLSRLTFIQRFLTSRADQEDQVDMRAEVEFYESGINETKGATGILLYTSLMEHRAVVLADQAISEKVPKETWSEVCSLLTAGIKNGNIGIAYSNAIKRCGDILANDFPIQPDDVNELRDHLVIKE